MSGVASVRCMARFVLVHTNMTPKHASSDSSGSDIPLVLVCAWCTDRWDGERWVRADVAADIPADATVSHGMCPTCAATHFRARLAG